MGANKCYYCFKPRKQRMLKEITPSFLRNAHSKIELELFVGWKTVEKVIITPFWQKHPWLVKSSVSTWRKTPAKKPLNNWIAKSSRLERNIHVGASNATSLIHSWQRNATFLPWLKQPNATFAAFSRNLALSFLLELLVKPKRKTLWSLTGLVVARPWWPDFLDHFKPKKSN